jgi:hypothetical protein
MPTRPQAVLPRNGRAPRGFNANLTRGHAGQWPVPDTMSVSEGPLLEQD